MQEPRTEPSRPWATISLPAARARTTRSRDETLQSVAPKVVLDSHQVWAGRSAITSTPRAASAGGASGEIRLVQASDRESSVRFGEPSDLPRGPTTYPTTYNRRQRLKNGLLLPLRPTPLMGLPCRVRVNYQGYAVAVHRRLCYPRVTSAAVVYGGRGYWTTNGAALPCEGELSRLRSGGTPASLLSSRHLSCRSIRGPGLLDERAEDLPH